LVPVWPVFGVRLPRRRPVLDPGGSHSVSALAFRHIALFVRPWLSDRARAAVASCGGFPSLPAPAGDAARGPFHYAWDLAPPYVMLLSPRLSPGPVAGSSAFEPLCRSAPVILRLAALINHCEATARRCCPIGRGPQSHPVVASGDGGSCSGIPLSPRPGR